MNQDQNVFPFIVILFFIIYTIKKFELLSDLDTLFLSRAKKQALKDFFNKRLHFFSQLSDKDKNRFVIRAYKLAKNINIIGRQEFVVTYDVKLYVVAAQVQLTLGFEQFYLQKFHTILIYPDVYRNKLTGKMHYGEVNPKGIIVISWKRFMKGYDIPDDKINLGLHEMAHALMHTIINSSDHENGLEPYLREIVRLSKVEMENIKNDDNHFFRSYASTNIYEFFAVAVEHFFESPQNLKLEMPTLYFYLSKLLKQDPSNNRNSYLK